ncbi:pilus assembly PilX family protein [Natronospira bacteriovora]|uniref:PilX N-terminal domain-containing pilus assembly protein n=1 Tax=Natronospira bacteriovora TaxID=3069753 RepID=A0ABU0W4B1_9GAMM|nr:PilX N-terminal domain-containing pilus assembly protein [Natronospira sp. AB-CW4]MDQ2068807.1 PilX N-terminal domain-containing pilus assembly protein [Natronospira sp. AB-CW4]
MIPNYPRPRLTAPRQQRGAALLFSLIILLLLTVIGVTALQTTTLQERMAGAQRDRYIAFQVAEATVREVERFLDQLVLPTFDGTNGLHHHASSPLNLVYEDDKRRVDWVATFAQSSVNPRSYDGAVIQSALPDGAVRPLWVVEEVPSAGAGGPVAADEASVEGNIYRITTLARGPSGRSLVVLQVVYRRGGW